MMRPLALAALILLAATTVSGHGAYDWIRTGGYIGQDNIRCCGANDCSEIAPADVSYTADGWEVAHRNRLYRFTAGTKGVYFSEDGHYYICWNQMTQQPRCFFHLEAGT